MCKFHFRFRLVHCGTTTPVFRCGFSPNFALLGCALLGRVSSTRVVFVRNRNWISDFKGVQIHILAVFSEHRYMLSPVRLSYVCLSVCNARAPYSGGCNFPQYFYGIWYPGHPLIAVENFTEIVPGEPLRRGS